jgi:hypothetical protein
MEALRKFVESPYLNMIVGLIVLFSGLSEAWGTLSKDIFSGNFGAHHGVMVFGFFQVLKSLPPILSGIKQLVK